MDRLAHPALRPQLHERNSPLGSRHHRRGYAARRRQRRRLHGLHHPRRRRAHQQRKPLPLPPLPPSPLPSPAKYPTCHIHPHPRPGPSTTPPLTPSTLSSSAPAHLDPPSAPASTSARLPRPSRRARKGCSGRFEFCARGRDARSSGVLWRAGSLLRPVWFR